MMRCQSVLGSAVPRYPRSACTGEIVGWYTLVGVREARPLCAGCLAVAANIGMDPVPVPQWRVRALEHSLPGRVEGGVAA